MTPWPGEGLRVLELGGGISAAFATRLLADFGASVIKVEPPVHGDPSRGYGPFPGDVHDPERSGMFLYLNFGKRGVTLDLETREARQRLSALLKDADLVIENLGPGEWDRLTNEEDVPGHLVICSISPYGGGGPKSSYAGSEISAYASGGMLYMTGTEDRPPVKQGYHQAAHLAGVNAAAASLAAARHAGRTGRGQRIDISEQETIAMTIFPALNVYTHTGAVVKRAPVDLPRLATSQAMRAADGWVMPADAGIDIWWDTFAEFVERPEFSQPPFDLRETRHQHEGEIDDIVGPVFAARTVASLFHDGQERGLTMSSVQDASGVLSCEQLAAREFFIGQDHPAAGTFKTPGMVPLTSGAIDRQPSRPAPLLGQHNHEVFDALMQQAPGRIARPASAPGSSLALEGVRILELGMVFVLPLAVAPLAALGADVIKIESASRPDSVRSGPMPGNLARPNAYNHAGNFHLLNRDKRGVTLDLTTERGRELFLRLVAVSDVVAENFTPRVLKNLGLDYERLREVNPDIILLSSTGFGQTGPWRNYKAYGPTTESVDGLMHVTGHAKSPPTRGGAGGFGVAFTDVAGAYFGSYSILAALEYRERTGKGMWLDLSHYEAGVATLPEPILDFEMNGRVAGRNGNRSERRAPQGVYPCAGEDEWLAISVDSPTQFASLVDVLGLRLMDSVRYAALAGRLAAHNALDAAIADATVRRNALELEESLQTAGVEATRLATPRDVLLDPQLRWRGFAQLAPAPGYAPEIGPRVFPRAGWLMGEGARQTSVPAPAFGQHTREVLTGLLGLTDADIEDLDAAGVIASRPRDGLVQGRALDLAGLLAARRLAEVDPRSPEERFSAAT
jgi:crotonobetainyl-CoA:carnitine CoA-transferase CaiB-like acyl-CoA transferase